MRHLLKSVLFLVFSMPAWVMADTKHITLHYIGPTEGQVWLGVNQGIDEANLQGRFLNQEYALRVIEADQVDRLEVSTALLLATDEKSILEIAQSSQLANVPVINVNAESDALRAACLTNLLHITPSKSMRDDALAQWQQKNPDTAATIQSWHPDFVKFAARQLNNRFEENQGTQMMDDGWAGWAASKMVADSIVQTNQSDAAFMLDHLKTDLVFDGQKGDNNNFRDNGQLRQIVMVVDDNSKILAEAPLRGFSGGLDSLGQSSCQ